MVSINIGTLMKNPEMFKFVPDDLKTKKMCKILENVGALKSVSDCCKVKKYVMKLFILIFLQFKLFMNAKRLKKCIIK